MNTEQPLYARVTAWVILLAPLAILVAWVVGLWAALAWRMIEAGWRAGVTL